MPDDDPPPPPQADSQREAAMAELGFEPMTLAADEGETIVVFVKLQANEIGANEV